MLATALGDVATIVLAVAAVIVAIAVLVLVAGRRFRGGALKVGPMEVTLQALADDVREVKKVANEVSKAVNNVPANVPTLVQRVGLIERRVARIEEMFRHSAMALRIIAGHVGASIPDLRDEDDERRSPPERREGGDG